MLKSIAGGEGIARTRVEMSLKNSRVVRFHDTDDDHDDDSNCMGICVCVCSSFVVRSLRDVLFVQ